MPRGGSRSNSRTSSRTNSASRNTSSKVQPAISMPTPAQKSGGMFSGFLGTMFSGMAFGAGSEVAHQSVRSVIGSDNHQTPQKEQSQNNQQQCINEGNAFAQCLQRTTDIQSCQSYLDSLKECQKLHI